MRFVHIILLSLFFAGGCSSGEPSTNHGDPDAWKAELLEADRAFNEATSKEGAPGWASFFAPNGSMISEGIGEIQGVEAVGAAMEGAFSDPSFRLTWEPLRAEVSENGDLGYTVGRYASVRIGDAGEEIRGTGLYVSIWRRQVDGSWKVEMDLGNPTSG